MPSIFHRLLPGDAVEERTSPSTDAQPVTANPAANELINAEELPSAAAKLAELFPDQGPASSSSAEMESSPEAAATAAVVADPPAEPASEPHPKPKRRGVFSWLFGPKESQKATEEISLLVEAPASTNGVPEASETVVSESTPRTEPVFESGVPALETSGEPIPAEQLPAAGELLAELFSTHQPPHEFESSVPRSENVEVSPAAAEAAVESDAELASPDSSGLDEPLQPNEPPQAYEAED